MPEELLVSVTSTEDAGTCTGGCCSEAGISDQLAQETACLPYRTRFTHFYSIMKPYCAFFVVTACVLQLTGSEVY